MSSKTREYKNKYRFYQIASVLLLFLPVGVFIVIAFVNGTTTQKMSLGLGVTLSLIFTMANVIFKLAPRSGVWVLIIALCVAVQKIQNVIYVTGACVILEEVVTSRLEKYYREKYKINREIDDRLNIKEEQANGKESMVDQT